MKRGSYYGGSTIIKTGNFKLNPKKKEKSETKFQKRTKGEKHVIGYILHNGAQSRRIPISIGRKLLQKGICKEVKTWRDFVSLMYKSHYESN
ncbi:hypothetical protein PsAD14_04081 [Pseudovibrio sp. Ad14]|nr:hypothetical protein PsW74_02942 [Pseudovibrio sp. W74]KZL07691.1 hypothetical protein PsAD14_04081 [Pseudovibrio sp. Ad14]